MERIDFVNDDISLIQNTDGLTFGTDALLLAAYVKGKRKTGLEIGSGSGIISLLLLSRNKLDSTVAVEVQETYARLTERNAEKNGFSDRLRVVCADVRDYTGDGECDLVYTNPPYMKTTSGKSNESEAKNAARHEVFGNISDFCEAAKRLLRFGGDFVVVYRPDRLSELMSALHNAGIEPKRMTLVHADFDAKPSMVLVSAKRGAAPGLCVTPPFFIYRSPDGREYSEDMIRVLENGSFPERYM